ncbi:MAG: hypothetical protein ISR65_12480 [Bacteriovoracaceae bacterium]|nr:hypothetical protein [Bacteriovoracaceae bacterium]
MTPKQAKVKSKQLSTAISLTTEIATACGTPTIISMHKKAINNYTKQLKIMAQEHPIIVQQAIKKYLIQ